MVEETDIVCDCEKGCVEDVRTVLWSLGILDRTAAIKMWHRKEHGLSRRWKEFQNDFSLGYTMGVPREKI